MLRDEPDVGGAVAARVPHLVRQHRPSWLLAEVDVEVRVEGQTALRRVHIHLHHEGTFPAVNNLLCVRRPIIIPLTTEVMLIITKQSHVQLPRGQGAVLLTVGRSYVGNHVTHSTLVVRAGGCSYQNLPKYRSYRVSNTAPGHSVNRVALAGPWCNII